MKIGSEQSILKMAGQKFLEIVNTESLNDADVEVIVKELTPQEAIGIPERRDFPIISGRERVIEAEVLGTRAQAFTDSPGEFRGKVSEILSSDLGTNKERAVFIAVLNAVLSHLGRIDQIVHCRDEEPEKCGKEIAACIRENLKADSVGLIGLNPAIAENLVSLFGASNVRITDLYSGNIGEKKFGVTVWDGNSETEELVKQSDTVLITGTTIVNGTIDTILEYVRKYRKDYIIYGMTAAGVCELLGLKRICPFGRNE